MERRGETCLARQGKLTSARPAAFWVLFIQYPFNRWMANSRQQVDHSEDASCTPYSYSPLFCWIVSVFVAARGVCKWQNDMYLRLIKICRRTCCFELISLGCDVTCTPDLTLSLTPSPRTEKRTTAPHVSIAHMIQMIARRCAYWHGSCNHTSSPLLLHHFR